MTEPTAANLNGTHTNSVAPMAVSINAQYIRDMSFENPNAPGIYLPQAAEDEPMLELLVNVQSRVMGDHLHEVILTMKATSKAGEKIGFIAELAYAGLFTVPALPEQQLRNLLLIECPRQLFPFARAVLSDMVRDGNFPPLLLAPIDFAGLYQQNAAQQNKATA
jgi:preprotein translocase subunit SecB